MKVLNRFMSALGYVPRSKIDVGSLAFDITVNSASVDAAIEKLGRMQRAAVEAEAAMNSSAALTDFGANDLCAESGRDLVLAEVRAQGEQIAKVLTMLEAQQRAFAKNTGFTGGCVGSGGAQLFVPATDSPASGLPG